MAYGRMYTFLKWKDANKEEGYRMSDPLQEMDGGAAAPMATPTNTPGMGNAVPADVDSDGSGDIFGPNKKKKLNEANTSIQSWLKKHGGKEVKGIKGRATYQFPNQESYNRAKAEAKDLKFNINSFDSIDNKVIMDLNEGEALPPGTFIDDAEYGTTVGTRNYKQGGAASEFDKKLADTFDGDNKAFEMKSFKEVMNMNEGRVKQFKFMKVEQLENDMFEITMKIESSGAGGAPTVETAMELTNNKKPKKLFPEVMHAIAQIDPKMGRATNVSIDGPVIIPHNMDDVTFRVKTKFN